MHKESFASNGQEFIAFKNIVEYQKLNNETPTVECMAKRGSITQFYINVFSKWYKIFVLSRVFVKAYANRRNSVGQQHAILLGSTCCVRLHGSTTMLALVAYNLRPVKLLGPCKRTQHFCQKHAKMLWLVASVCMGLYFSIVGTRQWHTALTIIVSCIIYVFVIFFLFFCLSNILFYYVSYMLIVVNSLPS